jgi:hypothetical protein
MWKWLRSAISGIRTVLKYASLLVVILSILGFSADALEKWDKDNRPAEEK